MRMIGRRRHGSGACFATIAIQRQNVAHCVFGIRHHSSYLPHQAASSRIQPLLVLGSFLLLFPQHYSFKAEWMILLHPPFFTTGTNGEYENDYEDEDVLKAGCLLLLMRNYKAARRCFLHRIAPHRIVRGGAIRRLLEK